MYKITSLLCSILRHRLMTYGATLCISFLLLVACNTNDQITATINEAEALAPNEPKRAIELMASIDREEIESDAMMARYALVYSEALYYNRSLISSDSLTSIAVDYYEHGGKNFCHEYSRAHYQHGLALNLAGRKAEAILSLNKALKPLRISNNKRLEGLTHRTMGDIYRASFLYHNSYDSYSKALDCFRLAELPYHIHYTLYNMGQAAVKMQQTERAEELFIEARDYAIEVQNLDLLCAILHEMCELYILVDDKECFGEVIDLFNQYDCALWFLSHYYAMCAIEASNDGDFASARKYIAMAEQHPQCDEYAVVRANYLISRNMGDAEQTIYWLQEIYKHINSDLLSASEQPVMNYQIDLLKLLRLRDEQEIRIIRHRIVSLYALILFIVLTLLTIMLLRRRQQKRDIQHYIDTIHELQLTRQDTQAPLSNAVDRLYNDRLRDLNSLCETYYDHSDTARHATKVFEQVRQTIEAIKSDEVRLHELETLVDSCRNGLMSKLRRECPKLNERELKVALYSYAGFSSRAICIFVDSNPVALSKIKYRIKTKIKMSEAKDAEQLIAAISDR